MDLGWPQWLYIILTVLDLGYVATHHGEEKTGTWNISTAVLVTVFLYWVLAEGGFFR